MPEAGIGSPTVHQPSQHMQILFWLSGVFSAFLPEYNMCIASRMVMFRESLPGHWLPLTACRILSTIPSFPPLFNLAHCQGNNKDGFCGRKICFRDVACDTSYYRYCYSPYPNFYPCTFYFLNCSLSIFFLHLAKMGSYWLGIPVFLDPAN